MFGAQEQSARLLSPKSAGVSGGLLSQRQLTDTITSSHILRLDKTDASSSPLHRSTSLSTTITMRRAADLVIDPELRAPSTSSSPTSSTFKLPLSAEESTQSVATTAVETPAYTPKPSIKLLFSFLTRHDLLFLVLPASISSACCGAVAPFMTLVIGSVFDAFARFPLAPNPPESAKHQLLHDIGITALELVGLAAGALVVSPVIVYYACVD